MMYESGLILEGGGMRGIYTAGVLEYFMEQNFYAPYVIGVSAGACFGASYLSRQKGRNRQVNIGYVKDPKYLSFRNYVKHRQLLGMDFIFDELPNKLVPYDFQAFNESKEEFVIVTTDCHTGKPIYFSKKDYDADLLTVLRASSSLPFIAPVIEFKGNHLLDGGIVDSIPLKKAQRDGVKKNIVILTRDRLYRKKKSNMKWLLERTYKGYPELVNAILSRYEMYNETLDYIDELENNGEIFVIRPSEPVNVSRIEKNQQKLEQLYKLGMDDARLQFTRLKQWLE
ncbi:patatin-like phospholipase family protein [Metabacillus malikii]|uniref:Patatin/cPLA2 family phospholipase n=1 Tax=Metabacillus malikii TaxID=1504265 RepID=A0ABT9ZC41_9BACI|nr:patatin family protein [Metabacillus malikii]MDQ0229489.1 putative patatin/cPLA2 family phospholipase [Metabacillus malikii]